MVGRGWHNARPRWSGPERLQLFRGVCYGHWGYGPPTVMICVVARIPARTASVAVDYGITMLLGADCAVRYCPRERRTVGVYGALGTTMGPAKTCATVIAG